MDDNLDVGQSPMADVSGEKKFTDIQVNDIVKREKQLAADRAAERVRQEMQAQHQAELEKLKGASTANSPNPGLDMEAFKAEVLNSMYEDLKAKAEKAEYDRSMDELNKIADQYHMKMGKGSSLFDDFNEVVKDFDPGAFSQVAILAGQLENTPEIIYELSRSPEKLAQIDALAQKSPALARKQLERLQSSISQNLEAKQNNISAPPPLSHVKSSMAGADNGKPTLKDFKRMFKG